MVTTLDGPSADSRIKGDQQPLVMNCQSQKIRISDLTMSQHLITMNNGTLGPGKIVSPKVMITMG